MHKIPEPYHDTTGRIYFVCWCFMYQNQHFFSHIGAFSWAEPLLSYEAGKVNMTWSLQIETMC